MLFLNQTICLQKHSNQSHIVLLIIRRLLIFPKNQTSLYSSNYSTLDYFMTYSPLHGCGNGKLLLMEVIRAFLDYEI